MKSRILNEAQGLKTYIVLFSSGDEAIHGLTSFATEHKIMAAHFTGIGAFENADLGYFDWVKKDYVTCPFKEQVEAVSFLGNISEKETGGPMIHAHVVLGRWDCSMKGGHLLKATVRPTLEVVVTEVPAYLKRRHDPNSGLALIQL